MFQLFWNPAKLWTKQSWEKLRHILQTFELQFTRGDCTPDPLGCPENIRAADLRLIWHIPSGFRQIRKPLETTWHLQGIKAISLCRFWKKNSSFDLKSKSWFQQWEFSIPPLFFHLGILWFTLRLVFIRFEAMRPSHSQKWGQRKAYL